MISVEDVTATPAVFRDLAMIKVAATPAARPGIVHLVDVFRARVVDVAPDSLIIEITGAEDKIDGLLEVLRPYGVARDGAHRPRGDGARRQAAQPRTRTGAIRRRLARSAHRIRQTISYSSLI